MSAVLDLILHFEDLSAAMDTRKVKLSRSSKSMHEKHPSRVKRLVAELTDIKRPVNKQKFITESTNTDIKSKTLPRDYKSSKSTTTINEKTIYKKLANISINDEEHESVTSVRVNSIKQQLLEACKQTPDIEKKVEVFGESLKQKRPQVPQTLEHDISELLRSDNSEETKEEMNEANYNTHCEQQEENINDILGFNTFEDSEDANYVTEAYNKEGFELVIATLEIKRRTLLLDEINEDVKDLIKNSHYVFHKSEHDGSSNNSTASETYENGNDEYEKYENTSERSYFLYNSLIPQNSPSSSSEKEIFDGEGSYEPDLSTYYYSKYDSNTKEEEENEEQNHFYQNVNNFSTCENIINKQLEDSFPETTEKKEKIDFLLVEIKTTEQTYISGLHYVVKHYIPYLQQNAPQDLIGRTAYLFGNIEEIYKNAKEFYKLMKENSSDPDSLAQIFIDSASTFELYPSYSKNKPTADIYFKQFEEVIKKRQMELGDKLGLASFLLTPIQRLGKYVLLLEETQKQLKKSNKPVEKVTAAINVIRNVMRKGNDFIAIDSIKDSPIDLTEKGSFIMRNNFTVLKPRKFQSMVFLFQNIIVFTEKTTKNSEYFRYYESIALSDLSLGKCEDKPNIFYLTNFTKSKRAQPDATFVVLGESEKVKKDWTETIGMILWSQLEKAKEQQTKLNHTNTRHPPKSSSSNGAIRKSKTKKYQTKATAKSKFYDHHYS